MGEFGKHATEGWKDLLAAYLGPAGATLVWTLLWVVGGVLALVFARYVGVLGAGDAAEGTPERRAYDNLRASLSDGGSPTRVYGRLLTRFLDGLDRFFGDHDKAHLGIFRHAFGLRRSYPLWTGAALDRCLWLALLYPVFSILAVWAISGHVGPAEKTLGLIPGIQGWWRGVLVGALIVLPILGWRALSTNRWSRRFWLSLSAAAFITAAAVAGLTTGASVGDVVGTGAVTVVATVAVAVVVLVADIAGAVAVAVAVAASAAGPIIGLVVVARAGAVKIALVVAAASVSLLGVLAVADVDFATEAAFIVARDVVGAFAVGCAIYLSDQSVSHHRQGAFLCVYISVLLVLIVLRGSMASPGADWAGEGPLLLFLGLFTLINAPFDWVSLGLTRALLRRGVELRGWWPYGLTAVDAALALVLVVALASVMVIGVQAFDLAVTLGGNFPVLQLGALFDGITAHPGDPANWWLYALLLTTLIPSIANLLIGSASLTRGVPGISTLLLRYMPLGTAVPAFERAWIAAVLTAQWALGAALMLASFALLGWLVAMLAPELGTWFLDYARWVADLDVPARAWSLVAR